jgi:hypothetical protein
VTLHIKNKPPAQAGSRAIILTKFALGNDRVLIHQLEFGSDLIPRIRLGITVQRGGALLPLDPWHSIAFDPQQLQAYCASVGILLSRVHDEARSVAPPELSFTAQIAIAAFRERRVFR